MSDETPQSNKDVFFGTSLDLPRVREVAITRLRPNPFQPRKVIDQEALQGLADSIKRDGLLSPITIAFDPDDEKKDNYIIIAGERRWRAHQLLEKEKIAVFVNKTGDPAELALIENLQREDLTPLELAEALELVRTKLNYKQEQLGEVIGKSPSTVSEILKINSLPDQIKEECREAGVPTSRSILLEIAKLEKEDDQIDYWKRVRAGNLTSHKQTRKARLTGSTRPPTPAVKRLVTAGNSFVKQLDEIETDSLDSTYEEISPLFELQHRMNVKIDEFRARFKFDE